MKLKTSIQLFLWTVFFSFSMISAVEVSGLMANPDGTMISGGKVEVFTVGKDGIKSAGSTTSSNGQFYHDIKLTPDMYKVGFKMTHNGKTKYGSELVDGDKPIDCGVQTMQSGQNISYTIHGTIVTPAGEIVKGAEIKFFSESYPDNKEIHTMKSDDKGYFEFKGSTNSNNTSLGYSVSKDGITAYGIEKTELQVIPVGDIYLVSHTQQLVTVTGTVKDKNDKGIEGVSISIKDKDNTIIVKSGKDGKIDQRIAVDRSLKKVSYEASKKGYKKISGEADIYSQFINLKLVMDKETPIKKFTIAKPITLSKVTIYSINGKLLYNKYPYYKISSLKLSGTYILKDISNNHKRLKTFK